MKKKLLGVAKLEDISTIDGRGYVYWVYIQYYIEYIIIKIIIIIIHLFPLFWHKQNYNCSNN